jgi:hypothetical protein
MRILIIVMLAGFGFWAEAAADKLTFYSPTPQFEIEMVAGKSITLKSANQDLTIEVKPCNQGAVDYFWESAVQEFKRHSKISGAPKSGEFAKLNNERRLVLNIWNSHGLRFLERDFTALFALSERQCR